jgi:hypothetical protein
MTLAELSKKYGVHAIRIGTWKRAAIASGNGTGLTSRVILKWAGDNDVDWCHIDPAPPLRQNAFIESLRG